MSYEGYKLIFSLTYLTVIVLAVGGFVTWGFNRKERKEAEAVEKEIQFKEYTEDFIQKCLSAF